MPSTMPQEMEVWYLIPAIRRELATIFVRDYHLSQKEAAQILGMTEAAISQYLKSKRAKLLKFNTAETAKIKDGAKRILADRKNIMKSVFNLCAELRGSRSVCELHRKFDKTVPANCAICHARIA